jgi:hypothetical protein
MNTLMFVLAVVCLMLAIIGAGQGSVSKTAAGLTGAVLFALLGIGGFGEDEHRHRGRWDA